MTTVRMYFKGERVGAKFDRATQRFGMRVRNGVRLAGRTASREILLRSALDIRSAGNFGSRWTDSLHADVTEGGGSIRIAVWSEIPYFSIHETGGIIHGRPLLWIPLSFAGVPKGLWARDYPGGLFRVDRISGGAPLLLSITDKQPKYFGKESVTLPKRFHIREIIRQVAGEMKDYYHDAIDATRGLF